jgi:hypothetical protein
MPNFYVVATERDGAVVPYFFETIWKPDLPVFSLSEAAMPITDLEKNYDVSAKIKSLKVDILLNDYIASDTFLKMCDSVGAKYFSVPVQMFFQGKKNPDKGFNFFCVTSRLSILDRKRSNYELAASGLSNPNMLPIYERISKFVVKDGIVDNLFFCEEIKKVVCSKIFKEEFESRGLQGVSFTSIDDSYVFAPWDDF